MGDSFSDVQALLHNINGGHERRSDHKTAYRSQQRQPESDNIDGAQLVSHDEYSGFHGSPRLREPGLEGIQPPLPRTRATGIFPSGDPDVGLGEELDDYDRALLAEPQPTYLYSRNKRDSTMAIGRLSLPNASLKASVGQRDRSASKPSSSHRVRTPPYQIARSSSPGHEAVSSPLFDASQRHSASQNVGKLRETAGSWKVDPFPSSATKTPGRRDSCQFSQDCLGLDEGKPTRKKSFSSHQKFGGEIDLSHAPPIIQGIPLIALEELPDRLRTVFKFNPFNAIQSKCFPTAYRSDDNLVVSAPTGSGKTVIFELAICRLVANLKTDQYKIIYMAPTKSLCSERCRDWQNKFAHLDLVCAELTGDTDNAHLKSVQSANVVVTTPEKWDSMTRQWKDHARLMQLVKLFLIDEVHMLRDNRGATLESVVSRMKSVGSYVRFIALSATVPNSEDVALWLRRNQDSQHIPACRETFGEEFRPVKLQKHIIGLNYKGSDYGFDSLCDPRLPDIIFKHGKNKPVMVFCMTRKSAASTAKLLANVWASKDPKSLWPGPRTQMVVSDPELKLTVSSAVAFHHAGVESHDRIAIEQGFLNGQINVICCTSTLAVGINLPCHLVIIKNTMTYQADGLKEYADLEIMQMLGRAGRPQFDDSAVAVIITKNEKVKKYEKLVSGTEVLESCLHLNLIDHLNAEIGLGTICDLHTAKRWLAGTFLYVRLGKNPEHYKLNEDVAPGSLNESLESICRRDIELLESAGLVSSNEWLKATELGEIMARYYVRFASMQTILSLGNRPKLSDILSALVQAEEFEDIRFKMYEKKFLKEINGSNGIKFPIKVDITLHAHKRSLLVQSELASLDLPMDEHFTKNKRQFQLDTNVMFTNLHRLVRCVIDVQIHMKDAVGARNALELARSFDARAWDGSPFQMKQIKNIGPVAVRKLSMKNVDSIEALEDAEPHRIELILSKNPPFGSKVLADVQDFPKLRFSIKMMGRDSKKGLPVVLRVKIEAGFINEKIPLMFNGKPVFVCLLTERSDGYLVDFRRISAKKLGQCQDVLISAEMTRQDQYLVSYVMCESVAGTLRYAELKANLPSYLFPSTDLDHVDQPKESQKNHTAVTQDEEYGTDEFNDQELNDIYSNCHFHDIDNLVFPDKTPKANQGQKRSDSAINSVEWSPEKLENGNWACNHKCKDKKRCRHICCHEGVDKRPKPPKSSLVKQSILPDQSSKKQRYPTLCRTPEKSDLIQQRRNENWGRTGKRVSPWDSRHIPRAHESLERLHHNVVKNPTRISAALPKVNTSSSTARPRSPFLDNKSCSQDNNSETTDYMSEDLPSPSALIAAAEVNERLDIDAADGGLSKSTGSISNRPMLRGASSEGPGFLPFNDAAHDGIQIPISDLDAYPTVNDQATSKPQQVPAKPNKMTDSKFFALGAKEFATAKVPKTHENNQAQTLHNTNTSTSIFNESTLSSSPPPIKRQKTNHQSQHVEDTQPPPTQTPIPKCSNEAINEAISDFDPVGTNVDVSASSAASEPTIKPGHPAWVYEFDPAFIAEYQDFVEFV